MGLIVDVHTNGVCIRGERSFEVDEEVFMEIEMPKGARCSGPVRARARRAWASEVEGADLFDVGFEFLRVEPASSAALAELSLRFSQ